MFFVLLKGYPVEIFTKYISLQDSSLCSKVEGTCAITTIKPGFSELWANSTSVIDFFSLPNQRPQGLNGKGSGCQIVSLHPETVALALKKEP